jgi:hypothetical protein
MVFCVLPPSHPAWKSVQTLPVFNDRFSRATSLDGGKQLRQLAFAAPALKLRRPLDPRTIDLADKFFAEHLEHVRFYQVLVETVEGGGLENVNALLLVLSTGA